MTGNKYIKNIETQSFYIDLMAAAALAFAWAVITGRMKSGRRRMEPLWSGAMSFILVITMIGSFSLTGCYYDVVPVIGGGGTFDTTDSGGLPTVGTFYFHPDHIGSVSYLTDSNGAVVTRLSYTPYGEKTKTGPDIFHQKYTGQVDDGDDAGLLYYKARDYDPYLGRFITADSIIPGADKTQAYNRYMYVVGNPVSYNDPDGHSWKSIVKKRLILDGVFMQHMFIQMDSLLRVYLSGALKLATSDEGRKLPIEHADIGDEYYNPGGIIVAYWQGNMLAGPNQSYLYSYDTIW